MTDDGTNPLIEFINKKQRGQITSGGTPEMELITNKDEDAPFSFIKLIDTAAGSIIMEYVDTGTPANSATFVVESGLITADVTKLRVNGALEVTDNIDSNAVIKGGAGFTP